MNTDFEDISKSIKSIYREVLDPIRDRFSFESRASDGELSGGPTALVVGNHSSGKSTFINFLLGQDVQKTGMAPTDDCFTILRYGPNRLTRDGHAVVNNPELPYGGLKSFGKEFVSHFRMHLLPAEFLKEVTLIDTPGMIDTADTAATRGYDFNAVVRSFAQRADIVLLFFDPDRPGTTMESLNILTGALKDMDHKLMVVMNKMDNFRSMRDFARCYGALCWNLGKVIKKKDIPLIYTTYVPVPGAPESPLPLDDFRLAREELIEAIRQTPARRVDNMITDCANYTEKLRLYVRVIDRVRGSLSTYKRRFSLLLGLLLLVGLLLAGYFGYQADWEQMIIALLAVVSVAFLGRMVIRYLVRHRERYELDRLDSVYEEIYRNELVVNKRPEDLLMSWREMKPEIRRTLESLGLQHWPSLKGRELAQLNKCLDEEFPRLRADLHERQSNAVKVAKTEVKAEEIEEEIVLD